MIDEKPDKLEKKKRSSYKAKILIWAIAIPILILLDSNMAANIVVMSWPATSGEIIELRHGSDLQNILERQVGVPQSLQTMQQTKIIYQYQVGGHNYKSSGLRTERIWSKNSISCYFGRFKIITSGRSELVDSKYPVGKKVTVHYDPSSPERACLEIHLIPGFLDPLPMSIDPQAYYR